MLRSRHWKKSVTLLTASSCRQIPGSAERVAIAQVIEQQVGNRQGPRTDKTLRGKIPEVAPGNDALGELGLWSVQGHRNRAKKEVSQDC